MGCGASTFNRDETGGVGGPVYLYVNPLHRDSPWRRKGNPSSKQLLDDPRVDEDGDSVVRKSVSLTPLLPKENGFKKEPPVQMMEIPSTKDVREERFVGGDPECDNRSSNVGDNRCDTDEDSDREDSIFYPGSPSFRDYCTSRYNDEDEEEDSDHLTTPINEGKSDSALTMKDSHKARKDQNCGNADPPKLSRSRTLSPSRKSKRSPKQRLRAVLPKRNRMSGMKNLLNGS